MELIRAFVGHSFSKRDKEVVDPILKCLDEIAALQPNFSWEHAEQPEATLVDQKVLAKLQDKNLFIGICTAKERAIGQDFLKRPWLSNKLAGAEKDFASKTSDWLIQEIGVALGRNMRIILLIEDNTRRPGEMQGNLEFIALDRNAPEKSFTALMRMVSALSNVPGTTAQPQRPETSALEPAPTSDPRVPEQPEVSQLDWMHPRPEWTQKEFNRALFMSVADGMKDIETNITTSFLASEAGSNESNRRQWAALTEYLRLFFQRDGKLHVLKELANKDPPIPIVWVYLARNYGVFGEHASAAQSFDRAIELESDILDRLAWIRDSALEWYKAGDKQKAETMIALARDLGAGKADLEPAVLQAELALADEANDKQLRIAILERTLQLDPSDGKSRFQLAFTYSELSFDELAAYHYDKIPVGQRDHAAWNNLGISLGSIGLPVQCIKSLRESESLGGTLAMANLGTRLLEAGFLREAREILERAGAIPDHSRNVDDALNTLKAITENEEKTEITAYESAREVGEFYRNFGRASARPDARDIDPRWQGPNGDLLIVTQNGKEIVIKGTYEVPRWGGLAAALIPAMSAATDLELYQIEYRGIIRGTTVTGTVTRTKAAEAISLPPILRTASSPPPEVLMWISDHGEEMSVLERPKGETRTRLSTLTRV